MVAPTVFVESGSATHFSTANEHNLVLHSPSFKIPNKRRHSVIKASTDSLHAIAHV
jgi:hypothetical protein